MFYDLLILLMIGLFVAPPIILIIRGITNIARAIKSKKKSEDVKYSATHYFLNFVIDALLFIIVLIRLFYDYKIDYCKYYVQHVMI